MTQIRSASRTVDRRWATTSTVIDDASMRTIFAGEGDSLLTGAEGRVFINCATISPAMHVEVEGLAKAAGAESLEGCMASSITQAREGTLYLMLGGDKATYDKVEELLGKLSVNKRHVGEAGKAAQVKALVNMVMNINTAGLAEGLGLADALGLDINMVMEIFSQTGANSRVLETDGEDMRDRDHEATFDDPELLPGTRRPEGRDGADAASSSCSGPALPPHTAETRYSNGSSLPPYLATNSREEASTTKAPTRRANGEICEAIVTFRTRVSLAGSGRVI